MALKQFKSRYANSTLGIWLAVINPLLIMLAITFVFSVIFKLEIERFPLFALAGIFPWMFFSAALSQAASAIPDQQSLLRQFNLPVEIIPLSAVISHFLNFLVGWCVIYPIFVLAHPPVLKLLPLLLLLLILHLCFTCGLGLTLACGNVFFRDLGELLGVFLMLWFWVTPIFYCVEMIPPEFQWILQVNPITPFILFYRRVIFTGEMPGVLTACAVGIWTLLSLLTGLGLFFKFEARLLKEI